MLRNMNPFADLNLSRVCACYHDLVFSASCDLKFLYHLKLKLVCSCCISQN